MTAIMGRMATYSGKVVTWDRGVQFGSWPWLPLATTWTPTPPVLPGKDGNYPCAVPGVTKVL